ncbi:MAG: IS200/IS605 family transposase [Bacteroidia bacterium]
MSNTYTQLHVQLVFAVKYREALIHPSWEVKLHQYITGIIRNQGHQMLAINGMPDYLHILLGWRPNQSISDLMKMIKTGSTNWINEEQLVRTRFQWQGGYGAFSYSKKHVPNVKRYIENQKEHHRSWLFLDEYKTLLKEAELEYDERYLFHLPL